MEQRSIVLIGNLEVDLVFGKLPRLPEWGEEKIVKGREMRAAGSAGYSAMAMGYLGKRPLLMGPVGNDYEGELILKAVKESGLEDKGIYRYQNKRTGLGATLVRDDGERCFVNDLGSLRDYSLAELESMKDDLYSADLVMFSGYFLMPNFRGEVLRSLFADLQRRGVQTALDTGSSVDGWTEKIIDELEPVLSVTDWFFPNQDELDALSRGDSLTRKGQYLINSGVKHVVVKLGSAGAVYFGPEGMIKEPGFTVEVIDTVGAGDVFNAGFLTGWQEGLPINRSLLIGNAAAALYISRRGFPSRKEVNELLMTKGAN